MTDAERALEQGQQYPYDAARQWAPDTARDWATRAARGVLYDLQGRQTLDDAFRGADEATRAEIVDAVAEVIREAERRTPRRPVDPEPVWFPHAIGDPVTVAAIDVPGTVTGLSVGPGGAQTVRVAWWWEGKRVEEWLPPWELEAGKPV